MLRVGLTGGIGAGKSMVAARLAEHGAVVVDSDVIAREVVEPGTDGLAAIVAEFGDRVLTSDGSLDRTALGRLVFGDDRRRRALNAIVHPLVGARAAELVAAAPADAIVVHDIPLLVENGLAPGFALVVVVLARKEQRVRRLVASRDLTEADVRARIASQATDEQRRAVANVVLDNSGMRANLVSRVDGLWSSRLVPFRDNLQSDQPAGAPSVTLAQYDPSWPEQYARIAARLATAGGSSVSRVDHIGSTAVPGLAAKDVIDVQVTVTSMADADALRDAFTDAGFPAVSRITGDAPRPPGADPAPWAKRLYGSADPGRPANVHLRVPGTPGWTFALAFRDWLRADADARAAYVTEKRRLARLHAAVRDDYAVAKEPWFDGAWPQVQAWVARTGWQPPE